MFWCLVVPNQMRWVRVKPFQSPASPMVMGRKDVRMGHMANRREIIFTTILTQWSSDDVDYGDAKRLAVLSWSQPRDLGCSWCDGSIQLQWTRSRLNSRARFRGLVALFVTATVTDSNAQSESLAQSRLATREGGQGEFPLTNTTHTWTFARRKRNQPVMKSTAFRLTID